MKIQNTTDLRSMLIETIDDVKSNRLGVKEANSVSSLTSKIIQTVKLDLQVMMLSKKYGRGVASSTTKLLVRGAA